MERSYFFDEGIYFACRQCGACCTGSSGTIYVSAEEIVSISQFLECSESEFIEKYLYPFRDSFSIKEKENGDCIFYEKGCIINPVKPNQCGSYPFWRENLRSTYKWKQTQADCPGIGKGRLYSKEEILNILENSVL
jgi:Fe-S-cluster containining protein